MYRALLVVLLVAVVAYSEAQLTFSPNWGKRSLGLGGPAQDGCKTGDALMTIYKLVQSEAERLLLCQK